jgi:hypothetical protein
MEMALKFAVISEQKTWKVKEYKEGINERNERERNR